MPRPNVLFQAPGTTVSGSVSTATTVLPARNSRVFLLITTPGTIYVTFDGTTASATNGHQVNATSPLKFDSHFIPTGPVSIFAPSSTTYSILWA